MDERDIHTYHGSAHGEQVVPAKSPPARLSDFCWGHAWLVVVMCLLAIGFGWKIALGGGLVLYLLDYFLSDFPDF